MEITKAGPDKGKNETVYKTFVFHYYVQVGFYLHIYHTGKFGNKRYTPLTDTDLCQTK